MSGVFGDVLRMLTDGPEASEIDINIDDVDVLAGLDSGLPSPGGLLTRSAVASHRNTHSNSNQSQSSLKPDPRQAWLRGRKRRASSALSLGLGLDLDELLPPMSPPPRSSKKKTKSMQGSLTPKFLADMGLRKSLIDILNVFNPTDGADKSLAGIAESPVAAVAPVPEDPDLIDHLPSPIAALGVASPGLVSSPRFAVVPPVPTSPFTMTVPPRNLTLAASAASASASASPMGSEAASADSSLIGPAGHNGPFVLGVNGRKRRNCGAATNPKLAATRNHVCEICESRFLCKSKLERHMRTHTGAKPFACYCGKQFNQKSALKNHSRRHIKKGDVPANVNMEKNGLNGFTYASLVEKLI